MEDSSAQTEDVKITAEASKESTVPKILYRLDYRDYTGNLLFRKQNNKPIDAEDAAKLHWDKDGIPQKPVIEILTEVRAQVKQKKKKDQKDDGNDFMTSDDEDDDDRHNDQESETVNVSNVGRVEMIIHSEFLMNAIRDVVKYYPGQNLWVGLQQSDDILIYHMLTIFRAND